MRVLTGYCVSTRRFYDVAVADAARDPGAARGAAGALAAPAAAVDVVAAAAAATAATTTLGAVGLAAAAAMGLARAGWVAGA